VTGFNDGFTKVPKLDAFVVNKPLDEIQKAVEAAFIPKDDSGCRSIRLSSIPARTWCCSISGFGDNGPPTTGGLAANMAAAGIDPKAIDTVIISHFHPDHISGLRAKAGAANFPNAEIMVPAGEWTYWNDASEIDKTLPAWKGVRQRQARVRSDRQGRERSSSARSWCRIRRSMHAATAPGTRLSSSLGNRQAHYIADVTNHPVLFAR